MQTAVRIRVRYIGSACMQEEERFHAGRKHGTFQKQRFRNLCVRGEDLLLGDHSQPNQTLEHKTKQTEGASHDYRPQPSAGMDRQGMWLSWRLNAWEQREWVIKYKQRDCGGKKETKRTFIQEKDKKKKKHKEVKNIMRKTQKLCITYRQTGQPVNKKTI